MRKSFLALSLMLATGSTALLLTGGASAQPASTAPAASNMLQLAQANVTPEGRTETRRARPAPLSAEQLAQRRADRCREATARLAGRLAYLETRLDLTANQRGAFNKWRDVRLNAANQRATACAAQPARQANGAQRPSPVDRMARQEQRLRQQLANLQAERPALEALFNSLTPEQRARFQPEAAPRRGIARGPIRGPAGGRPPVIR